MQHDLLEHPSAPEFLRGFQEEHLSEIEFLLGHRRRYLRDPERSWLDAEGLELRLERQLEAMRAGGRIAISCAREALVSGDEWLLPAALYVLTSLAPELVTVEEVLQGGDDQLAIVLQAWQEALSLAGGPKILGLCARALADERPEIRAAALRVLSFRREGDARQLLPLLGDPVSQVRSAAAVTLAKLRCKPALLAIEQLLGGAADSVIPILEAALLLGSRQALLRCRQLCRSGNVSHGLIQLLAVAGNEHDLPLLRELWTVPASMAPAIEALGIIGVAGIVPDLLAQLSAAAPELRNAAASALAMITGAGLRERIWIRDPESQGEELAEGREIEQPSTSVEEWSRWWGENRVRFRASGRFRRGHSYTPWSCVKELEDPRSPFEVRARAGLELGIRSGQIDFEPGWFVQRQREAIAQAHLARPSLVRG